jgi:hypothetical protein
MPKLSNIVDMINCNIKSNNFSSARFQSGKLYNISDPVKSYKEDGSSTTEPMIIDDNGECTNLSYDDSRSFTLFHTVEEIEYNIPSDDYGRPGTTMMETANMKLIFTGSRRKLKFAVEDIIAAVIYDIPKEFLPIDICNLNLTSCIIEVGIVDSNIYNVWDDNWINTEMRLNTESIAFSIKYKIISTYNKCFSLCPPKTK